MTTCAFCGNAGAGYHCTILQHIGPGPYMIHLDNIAGGTSCLLDAGTLHTRIHNMFNQLERAGKRFNNDEPQ